MGLAASAILVLGGAAILFILALDARGPSAPDAPPPAATSSAEPIRPPAAPEAVARVIPPPPPPEPVVFEEPPPPAPEDSWDATPAAPRAARLGAIGPAVSNELALLQERINGCFDEDVQARHGPTPVSRLAGGRGREDSGSTLLVLLLEVRPGRVTIVDAPVESQGAASDGLVACAQQILRNHVVKTPAARVEGRARLVFPLNP